MMSEKKYTEEDVKAIQLQMYNDLRNDALDKLKRIEFHLKNATEFSGVGFLEGMNFVLDDLDEVILNWES